MISALAVECAKARRRHVIPTALVLLAIEFMWVGMVVFKQQDGAAPLTGLLYLASTLNAIFFPLLSAIVACVVTDIENRADAWKLLLTLQPSRELLVAKWVFQAAILAVVALVQCVLLVVFVYVGHSVQTLDVGLIITHWFSTFIVSLMVATGIQALCLFSRSQFVPMACGVLLSFVGLFALYLPSIVTQFVPSSYFGLLSRVMLEWNPDTQQVTYQIVPWSLPHVAVVIALIVAWLTLSLAAFEKKEV